jgi:hypothetical protein
MKLFKKQTNRDGLKIGLLISIIFFGINMVMKGIIFYWLAIKGFDYIQIFADFIVSLITFVILMIIYSYLD